MSGTKLLKRRSPEYYAACHNLLPASVTRSGGDVVENDNCSVLDSDETENQIVKNTSLEDFPKKNCLVVEETLFICL